MMTLWRGRRSRNRGKGKRMTEIRCMRCGKTITPGNRPDGIPNGVGFEIEHGVVINICAECMIEEGKKREGQ